MAIEKAKNGINSFLKAAGSSNARAFVIVILILAAIFLAGQLAILLGKWLPLAGGLSFTLLMLCKLVQAVGRKGHGGTPYYTTALTVVGILAIGGLASSYIAMIGSGFALIWVSIILAIFLLIFFGRLAEAESLFLDDLTVCYKALAEI